MPGGYELADAFAAIDQSDGKPVLETRIEETIHVSAPGNLSEKRIGTDAVQFDAGRLDGGDYVPKRKPGIAQNPAGSVESICEECFDDRRVMNDLRQTLPRSRTVFGKAVLVAQCHHDFGYGRYVSKSLDDRVANGTGERGTHGIAYLSIGVPF
jgi:hypothetical protein